MHKALLVFLSSVLLSCVPTQVVTTPVTPEQSILDNFDTVATLVFKTESGELRPYCSGAFVHSYVVTAAHCVIDFDGNVNDEVLIGTFQDYDVATGKFSNTYLFHPEIVWDVEDVALLSPDSVLSRAHHGTASVSTTDVTYGDSVQAFGNPIGYVFYFSRGQVVSPLRSGSDGMPYTLINAVVYPGMSGGPVFNDSGEIVGLVSWGWRRGAWNMVGIVHRTSVEEVLRRRGVVPGVV